MKISKLPLIILVAIVAIILLSTTSIVSKSNRAVSLEEQVNSAKSDINVQEKRREDLLYNLVDTVKQYDEHEYQTLMDVISSRNTTEDTTAQDITTQVNAVSEAYPDLKSNENYKSLMLELSTTENLIANYRSNYNSQIKNYNRFVRAIQNKFLLNITGYEYQTYEYLDYNASEDAPTDLFKDEEK